MIVQNKPSVTTNHITHPNESENATIEDLIKVAAETKEPYEIKIETDKINDAKDRCN